MLFDPRQSSLLLQRRRKILGHWRQWGGRTSWRERHQLSCVQSCQNLGNYSRVWNWLGLWTISVLKQSSLPAILTVGYVLRQPMAIKNCTIYMAICKVVQFAASSAIKSSARKDRALKKNTTLITIITCWYAWHLPSITRLMSTRNPCRKQLTHNSRRCIQ